MADITTFEDRAKKQKRHKVYIVFDKNGPKGLFKTKCPVLGVKTRAMALVMVVPDQMFDRYEPPSAEVTLSEDAIITPEVQVLDALAK